MPLLTLFVCSRPIQGRPACWGPWDWSAIPRNSWGGKISVKNGQSLITSSTRWTHLCVDHFVIFLHEVRFALQHEGHLELVPLLSENSIGKLSKEANGKLHAILTLSFTPSLSCMRSFTLPTVSPWDFQVIHNVWRTFKKISRGMNLRWKCVITPVAWAPGKGCQK